MDGEKGMTAVEVLLTLALWVIIMALLLAILFFMARGYEASARGLDAQYSARMVVFNINRDIRKTETIELIGNEKIICRDKDTSVSYYMEKGIVYRHGKAKIPIAEKVLNLRFDCRDQLIYYSVATGDTDHQYNLEIVCCPRRLLD
ncbi:MAG: hypothetical protein GX581_03005 [Syntrophomonadaceae bacterium]|jgi:hypothetical protein|nr:hypothetical protein [Syntrophomonadaceae bacterium]